MNDVLGVTGCVSNIHIPIGKIKEASSSSHTKPNSYNKNNPRVYQLVDIVQT